MSKGKILIVDDEPAIAKVLDLFLTSEGYDTLTAHTGEVGIEVFRDNPCDMLITDFDMPGINGLEAARKMLELKPDLTVIVISGSLSGRHLQQDEIDELPRGILLTKPFQLDDVGKTVGMLFGSKPV